MVFLLLPQYDETVIKQFIQITRRRSYKMKQILLNELYNDRLIEMSSFYHESDGTPVIRLDTHYMSCNEARNQIKAIIAKYPFEFKIYITHGYNNGIAIKTMIRNEAISKRITRIVSPRNPGQTIIEIS